MMTLFGGRDDEWESVKEDYRQVKVDILEAERQIQIHLNAAVRANLTKYQYIVEDDIEEDRLSQLGQSGWELVNFASYTTGWGVNGNSAMKVHFRYVFKGAISEVPSDAQAWMDHLKILRSRRTELVSAIEERGYNAE